MMLVSLLTECGPDVSTRLVELHTDDGTGGCAARTHAGCYPPAYPCSIRTAAVTALHMHATNLGVAQIVVNT